jgi:hypothetical protein
MSDPHIRAALREYTVYPSHPLPDSAVVLAVARRAHRSRTLTTASIAAVATVAVTAVAAGFAFAPAGRVRPRRYSPASPSLTT